MALFALYNVVAKFTADEKRMTRDEATALNQQLEADGSAYRWLEYGSELSAVALA